MEKLPTPRTIESMRTLCHLQPTTQQNAKRHASEDRFTVICMVVSIVASALVWLAER
jgi:hypothetical protein